MIRILHIVGSMERNGLQTFIMNVYRKIDRNRVQFDFIQFNNIPSGYDNEILSLGGKIYRLPSKSNNLKKCLSGIKDIVKNNNYKIVHRHYYSSSMVIELLAAKMGGAEVLISHSHSTKARKRSYLHYVLRPLLNKIADIKIACSENAGTWMYNNMPFAVINNCIDVSKYKFNQLIRQQVRDEIGVNNSFVIGNVARFEYVKNHEYMLAILKEFKKQSADAKLLLVGTGSRMADIRGLVKQYNLEKDVYFVGEQKDVCRYLQAFDVFILPSFYEGIPLALIEAQANGLTCLVSNTVDRELDLTGNVRYLGISENSLEEWCANLNTIKKGERNINTASDITNAGYSSASVAEKMMKIYLNIK